MERLSGGSKKGVYRLIVGDDFTAIACVWDDTENYWPATQADGNLADPFSPLPASPCSRPLTVG